MVAEYEPDLEVISGGFFRRDRVVPAILAIIAILLSVLIVRDAFFPPATAAAAAQTSTVNVGNVTAAVSGTGTVMPNQQQNVNLKVSGTLTEVDVNVGDQVTAGQTLAKIDPTTYQNQLNTAQSQLTLAQAGSSLVGAQHKLAQDQAAYNLQHNADANKLSVDQNQFNVDGCVANPSTAKCETDQATIDQDQIKLQADQNTITNDQDAVNTATLSQQNSVQTAQIAVQNAQQQLNDTTLTAPMSGTVMTLNGQVGDAVGSGGNSSANNSSSSSSSSSSSNSSNSSSTPSSSSSSSAFISLGNLSAMQVLAPFAEADAAKVKANQTASFTFDAIPNLTLTGHVISVAAAATTVSNVTNYYVTLALDGIDQRLKSGMTANASVIVSQASNVLAVPNSAITRIGTAAYVTVLGSDGKRTRIPIQTGTVGDNTTEVASGLVQGEKVVLPQLTTPTSTGTTGAGRLGGGAVIGGGGAGGGGGGGGGRFGG